MNGHPERVRRRGQLVHGVEWQCSAAAAVVRVLNAQKLRTGRMQILGARRGPDFARVERAIRAVCQRPGDYTCEPGGATKFVLEDVALVAEKDLVAGPG